MATQGVAIGQAIAVRMHYTAGEVRWFAKTGEGRPAGAIAAVLDEASQAERAKSGGMDRQTRRD